MAIRSSAVAAGDSLILHLDESGRYYQQWDSLVFVPDGQEEWEAELARVQDGSGGVWIKGIPADRGRLDALWLPAWTRDVESVGDGWEARRWPYTLPLVADLRNDGVRRSYFVESGVLWEMESWNATPSRSAVARLDSIVSLTIARCRPDGRRRLYAATANGAIHEVGHEGGVWRVETVMADAGVVASLASGDPLGRGVDCLYWVPGSSTAGMAVRELARETGAWRARAVLDTTCSAAALSSRIIDIVIGDVRGDGIDRMYLVASCLMADSAGGSRPGKKRQPHVGVLELSLGPDTARTVAQVLDYTWCESAGLTAAAVAPIGTEGRCLLFAMATVLYQLAFVAGEWEPVLVSTNVVGDFTAGDVRGDGVGRVYALYGGVPAIEMAEFSFESSGWHMSDRMILPSWERLGSYGIMGDLVAAAGRADGGERLYVETLPTRYEISFVGN